MTPFLSIQIGSVRPENEQPLVDKEIGSNE